MTWITFGSTSINPESFDTPELMNICDKVTEVIEEHQLALISLKNEIYSRAKLSYDDMGNYITEEEK